MCSRWMMGPRVGKVRSDCRSPGRGSRFSPVSVCSAVLKRRDLPGLGALAERNALRMHADAMAADPPLLYWEPATLACLRELQSEPRSAWPTIDAGPHVVAICAAADAQQVETRLRSISGVKDVIVCAAAGGARLVP